MKGPRQEATAGSSSRPAFTVRGQRRLTPAMLKAEALHAISPMSDARKGEIIVALKAGGAVLGVPRRVREFLVYLISWTFPCDWEPGATPIAAPSNRDIGAEFEIERTQIKALCREAAELGLVAFRDSPTGRRYVRRDGKGGPILDGYGFDLSPLSKRYDELIAAKAAHDERRREGERLRRDVTVTLARINAMAACADEMGVMDDPLRALATEARQLALLRGTDRDPTHLSPIVGRLVEIRDTLDRCLSVSIPVETDPVGSLSRPPYTTTNPASSAYTSRAEGPFRPSADGEARSRNREVPAGTASPVDNPLRGFVASPVFLLMVAPLLREFCPTARPSETQLVEAASQATHHLGISQHAWAQACSTMGRYGAAAAIAVIAARQDAGKVRSPGGLLRAMIDRHADGSLHLDKTLFGLADALGERMKQVTGPAGRRPMH